MKDTVAGHKTPHTVWKCALHTWTKSACIDMSSLHTPSARLLLAALSTALSASAAMQVPAGAAAEIAEASADKSVRDLDTVASTSPEALKYV